MRLAKNLILLALLTLYCATNVVAAGMAGTWKSVEYVRNGRRFPEMVGKAVYEFKPDKTYTHKMGQWTTAKGTYKVFEGKIELTNDIGRKTELRMEKGKLVSENKQRKLKIVYEKSD